MTIFEIILAATGTIAIGYGLNGVLRQRLEIYTKGQIRLYEKLPAQLIGGAFLLAGIGAFALGYFGISAITMIFGMLCTGAYFGLRAIADQVQANRSDAHFSVPSQPDSE
ncbi:MAG: hypothetical protein CUN55_10490 [Phototrophicales bacterium]|nr:MAG: hypothetical protein CUN55_10490 [Phototrophicales bacterium]